MSDLISRQSAIDALAGMIDRFERILADIRETKIDDSVCGMCEYDGAYIGQSGEWCNECPGFDKDNCFKLSDKCRKRWLKSVELPPAEVGTDCISRQAAIDAVESMLRRKFGIGGDLAEITLAGLPSAQPEKRTEERTETHACDLISRQAAIDALYSVDEYNSRSVKAIKQLPPIQPDIVRCGECKWFQCNMRPDGYLPQGVDEFECRHWCGSCDPTDFCSYGEKERGEQDG